MKHRIRVIRKPKGANDASWDFLGLTLAVAIGG